MSEVSEVRVILEHVALRWRYGTVDRSVHEAGSGVFSFEMTETLHEFLWEGQRPAYWYREPEVGETLHVRLPAAGTVVLAHSAATLTPTEVFRLRVEGESLRSHPFWSDLYLPKFSYRRCSCPRRCPICSLQNPPDSKVCQCGFEFGALEAEGSHCPTCGEPNVFVYAVGWNDVLQSAMITGQNRNDELLRPVAQSPLQFLAGEFEHIEEPMSSLMFGPGSTPVIEGSENQLLREHFRNQRKPPGDWTCPECNNHNFSFRTECNSCGEPRGNTPDAPPVLRAQANPVTPEEPWFDEDVLQTLRRTVSPAFLACSLEIEAIVSKVDLMKVWQAAGCPKTPEQGSMSMWRYVLNGLEAKADGMDGLIAEVQERMEVIEKMNGYADGTMKTVLVELEPRGRENPTGSVRVFLRRGRRNDAQEHASADAGESGWVRQEPYAFAAYLLERLDDLGLEQYPILIEHLLHGRFDLDEAEALLSRHSERSEVVQRVVEGGEDLMAVEVDLGLYQF